MAAFQLFINCFHCVRDATVQVPFLDPCQIAPYRRLAEKLVLSDRDLHLTHLFLEILYVLQVCDANVLHLSPSFTPLYHGCEGFCRSDIRGYYLPKSPRPTMSGHRRRCEHHLRSARTGEASGWVHYLALRVAQRSALVCRGRSAPRFNVRLDILPDFEAGYRTISVACLAG